MRPSQLEIVCVCVCVCERDQMGGGAPGGWGYVKRAW